MTKLKMLRPPLKMAASQIAKVQVVADRRITGRRLQARRLAVWQQDPTCAACGRVVDYPGGFELDHKVPLFMGGEDVEANCQVLCVRFELIDGYRIKVGCHASKTAREVPGS
ncbi:HNH endonuclease signature motif containing protein [Pseudomonas sp. AL 58]|uniref:HNH endonuclease signature motif containing protein n=1 Tax=Pseudomonas sp. AL 58 TaxID=3104275 RepID=UPI002E9FA743|nr:HNH endonuclease signature motif containing protein [Pseudomonas sp. AL 58]